MITIRNAVRSLALALPLTVALAGTAHAGTLQVRDEASLLSPADTSALRGEVDALPFDVRVWTTNNSASRATFDAQVGRLVSSPRMVVIAVDPVNRRTSVHFGLNLGVPSAQHQGIRDAAGPSFRQSDWRGGMSAIVRATAQHATMSPVRAQSAGFPWGLVLLGIGTIAGVALLVRFVRGRAQQMGGYPGANPHAPGYYDPNMPPQGGMNYGPGYHPGYGPGYGPSGGSGLGAGLVGAGLGGLAGYAIGRSMSDQTEHHGAESNASSAGFDSGGDSYDAGGGTSDWGGGDSGGGDSGGGGDW